MFSLAELVSEPEWSDLWTFLEGLKKEERRVVLRNDLVLELKRYFEEHPREADWEESDLWDLVEHTQEVMLGPDQAIVHHRPKIGRSFYYRLHYHSPNVEPLEPRAYLDIKDALVLGNEHNLPETKLLIDFDPFYDFGPTIRDSRKVGQGLRFLNSYMASNLSRNPRQWLENLLDFLKIHHINGRQLLLEPRIVTDKEGLYETVNRALQILAKRRPETPFSEVEPQLARLGLAPGFGNTVARIRDTLELLLDLFEEPSPETLEAFIDRIPMISKVAVLSPHGWFGQENVLGRPDTGGQVVYILDQVRALEAALSRSLEESGLSDVVPKVVVLTRLIPEAEGTTCNLEREKIYDTRNCWILRVPFHRRDGSVHPHWLSRFDLWPYLERFAYESKFALEKEFEGRPDAVVGNYSDGNLVAALLAEWMGIIQINIAHALEKSKYLFSALYWKEHEQHYHFSAQFTADLLAMNRADFIITSTLQEIVGTPTTMGQYESYVHFTMPGLYQVAGGINLFHPKFNVIPPGVDERTYYPPQEGPCQEMEDLLFAHEDEEIVGVLDDPDRIPIFSMARLDRIKNLTGLLEAFGRSEFLKARCNLILVAGKVRSEAANDAEERAEIERMYHLLDVPGVRGKVRWLGKHLRKDQAGEAYRVIAARRGIFVQPALFEAFGLTVLEAMACGVPTFATQFGGPQEILSREGTGYLINPTRPDLLVEPIERFLEGVEEDPALWDRISRGGIRRVQERFNWSLYAEELLKRIKLYGFWRYAVAIQEKRDSNRYCDVLFHLLFKRQAAACWERT